MTKVTIYDAGNTNLESIGDYAFHELTGLTSFDIPSTVKTIGKYAFYNTKVCDNVLPEGIVTISNSAFSCPYLTYVSNPVWVITHMGFLCLTEPMFWNFI